MELPARHPGRRLDRFPGAEPGEAGGRSSRTG